MLGVLNGPVLFLNAAVTRRLRGNDVLYVSACAHLAVFVELALG